MAGSVGNITTNIIKSGLVFNMDAANRAFIKPSLSSTTAQDTVSKSSGSFYNDTFWDGPTTASLAFDAVNDYILFENKSELQITGPITIGIWFKFAQSGTSTNMGFLTKGTGKYRYVGNSSNKSYEVEYYANKALFQIGNGSTASGIYSTTGWKSSNVDGNWHYLTCLWKGNGITNNLQIYADGILDNQSTNTTISSLQVTTTPLMISDGFPVGQATSYPFYGNIGPTHIYNRALSANEVLHNYNALKSRFE